MGNQLNPLPVTLVLGFTGSGKTTLIEYLTHQQGIPVQVIQSGSQQMSNGCICCTGLKDLKHVIDHLLADRESGKIKCEQLFIEASDETDPIPVTRTIRQRFASDKLFLREVITVINAANYPPTDAQRYLITNQIFFADRIIVNHCDLATGEQLDQCHKQIRGVKWQPTSEAIRGVVDPKEVLGVSGVKASVSLTSSIQLI
ncbi:MAG: GTP-binding protein [Calothrix sp. MO_192.B10]|nr:GTP-binding protein [Calothrix sp. MO_192.B10]